MEKYIRKINDKILSQNDMGKAKKVKMTYQIIGGVVLGLGLAGFLAMFIMFMVLFLKFKTDDAFTAWLIAIPFIPMIVAGSVLSRIGDALLPKKKSKESDSDAQEDSEIDKTQEATENNNKN